MSLPIRCFTCNKVISQYENSYIDHTLKQQQDPIEFFNKHDIKRYCCRRMFMTTCYDLYENMIPCSEESLPPKVSMGETKEVRILRAI